jgi:hypothetical protein
LTGITGTSYSDWSGKTSNSTAVYKGQSAGGNDAIQLRSSNNNSGIVTTASGGTVRKVVVTWQSGTASGRELEIYGKNTAYSAATDLYSTNATTKGTKLGSIVYGTSTELTISGDYAYIGLRSKSGAMYITEIQITWETGEGGGSTPEPEPATPVLSVNPTSLSFDAAAGSKTIACTIENEVSGVNVTATESVDWLSTSVSGKTVTVTATANTTTSERTATVTIAYTGAVSKTVTVNQAAAEVVEPEQPGGGETQSVTESLNIYGTTGVKNGTTSVSWDSTNFTVTNTKTSNSNALRTSDSDHYRVYQNSQLVLTAKNNKKFTKLVITVSESKYAAPLVSTLGTGATASGTTVTWVGSASEINQKVTAQTRISKVEATLE